RLWLRRPLRRSRNILRLLLVGLLLLRLLGLVLLESVGDEIALGLGFFLRFLLGLRRRWRRRRIGRSGDLLGRNLGGGIVDLLLLVDFLHQRLLFLLGHRRRALRHLAGGRVGDDVDRNALDHRLRQARRRKAHQRRAQDDEVAAARYGPVRPQRLTFSPVRES